MSAPTPRHAAEAAPPLRIIEVFADVSCPFAHVSLRRFVERRRTAGADGVKLRVRAWPLELVNGTPLTAAKVAEEVDDLRAQVAGDLFSAFDPAAFPASTLRILGAATLAYEHGTDAGERFNLAVRDALFERGVAVAERDVLAGLAAECGVGPLSDAAVTEAAAHADLEEGRQRGVIGSPHFFIGEEPFFCPALDIERQGDHLHITVDHAAVEQFLERAFG